MSQTAVYRTGFCVISLVSLFHFWYVDRRDAYQIKISLSQNNKNNNNDEIIGKEGNKEENKIANK